MSLSAGESDESDGSDTINLSSKRVEAMMQTHVDDGDWLQFSPRTIQLHMHFA